MGPIEGSRGINFTAWSYGDDFAIGIQACREHAPDFRQVADYVAAELAAFTTAASQPPADTATSPPQLTPRYSREREERAWSSGSSSPLVPTLG